MTYTVKLNRVVNACRGLVNQETRSLSGNRVIVIMKSDARDAGSNFVIGGYS